MELRDLLIECINHIFNNGNDNVVQTNMFLSGRTYSLSCLPEELIVRKTDDVNCSKVTLLGIINTLLTKCGIQTILLELENDRDVAVRAL